MTATLRNTRSTAAGIPRTDPISTERFPNSGRLPSSSREANRISHHQEGFAHHIENPPLPRVEVPHRWMSYQPGLLCHNLPSKNSLSRNMDLPRNTNLPRNMDLPRNTNLPRNMDLPRNTDLQRSHKSKYILKLPGQELHYYHDLSSRELPCDIDLRPQRGLSCRQDTNYNKILPTRQEFTIDLDYPCDQKATSYAVTASEESWTIKFQNLQRLLETQDEILANQSRRLEQCEHQIESYETRTHSLRVSEDGDNYIQRSYLETFGRHDKDAREENSTPNGDQGASYKEVNGTGEVEKCASTELNESRESRQQTLSRRSTPDSDLVELEELRKRLTKLVAISEDYNSQLIQLSCQIAHYDGEIQCKRLQLGDLQEQYDLLRNTDRGSVDQCDCPETGSVQPILLNPQEQQVQKRQDVDCCSYKSNRLFLTIVESDTGLSSLGSESSFDLSPAESRHKLNEIPLKNS